MKWGWSAILAVAMQPDACNRCPSGYAKVEYRSASVPVSCAFTVTNGPNVVTYVTLCHEPVWQSVTICEQKPGEKLP